MYLDELGADRHYVLVDDTPVQVGDDVQFMDHIRELDLPFGNVGVYTDGDGERRMLPPTATVAEHVPP